MSEPAKNLSLFSDVLRAELKELLREVIKEELGKSRAAGGAQDKLLSPTEAAEVLAVSEDWLYHNAKKLPFTRKLGPRLLRFSHIGIIKWMESKKLSSV